MRSKILVIFLLFSMLTACASNKDKESALLIEKSNTGNYDIVIPYEMSSTREYHTQYANSSEDFDTIGSRLLEISKEYFPTNEYVLGEGSVITYSRLIQLVGRESDTQEMGLNPRRGENLDIGVKGVEMVNAVLIRDVVEQDFYKMKDGQAELEGISLCVVLNPVQDVVRDGKTTEYTLSDDFLFDYGTMMSRKLERYMRTLGESRDVPILITLYVNGESGSYVPGYMLGKALFKDRTPSFERMNEKWVLYPSNEATSIDSDNTAQFSTF
ncbi:MAG: CamS family sex pheromone protein, partial [Erysipelotrichales bacterium]|nr:CamS family sex pheromone protein [Erysipelotrichales bacterium]